MTSSRQRDANRRNARRRTGPRTAAGKAAARLNARRHGLAVPLRSEPGADKEIERLADAIAGARSDLMDLARRIAEAELELRRIRQARLQRAKNPRLPRFLPKTIKSPNYKLFMWALRRVSRRKNAWSDMTCSICWTTSACNPTHPLEFIVPSRKRLPNLEAIAFERYERRALSRGNPQFAILMQHN